MIKMAIKRASSGVGDVPGRIPSLGFFHLGGVCEDRGEIVLV